MKIIADENIPSVTRAFSTLGEVSLLAGRQMRATDVRDADVLLVRSVTRVGRELLAGSRVRFVGSATIGFDHVDLDYLEEQGIGFATAPGSNAASAAEYVVSAILALAERDGFNPAEKSAGIIGCGNVGSRVRQQLTALGMRCLVNDPPLQARGGYDDFLPLDDALQADIVTLHVPLTRSGAYPTRHLADRAFLERLRTGAMFVNTARGAVVDNAALNELLAGGGALSVVLDVWEGEPAINMELLGRVAIGTPHIAGYSLDGKLRGTEMVYRAVCGYFDLQPRWSADTELPVVPPLELDAPGDMDTLGALRHAVFHSYDVRRDDAQLRGLLSLAQDRQPAAFDRLRRDYPPRREFSSMTVIPGSGNDDLRHLLQDIGFRVV